MQKRHHCDALSQMFGEAPCVAVAFSADFDAWVLVSQHAATEQDVRMGEAEQVGEWVFSSEIRIHYCPYCGVQL